ncbi:uncharacterized protein [Oscarella lobularis]|uniref:uncharacterized protein isoform X2 n=1 Tax=Oscarella lobularis TaxID=121494 RepID=UPI00331414F6
MADCSEAIERAFTSPDLTSESKSTPKPLADHPTVKDKRRLTTKISASVETPLSSQWAWLRSRIHSKSLEHRRVNRDVKAKVEKEEESIDVVPVSRLHSLAGAKGSDSLVESGMTSAIEYGFTDKVLGAGTSTSRQAKNAVLSVLQGAVKRISPEPETGTGSDNHHVRPRRRSQRKSVDNQMEIMSAYWESFYKFHGRYPVPVVGNGASSSDNAQPDDRQRSPGAESRQSTSSEFDEDKASHGLWGMALDELRDLHHEMSVQVKELSDVLINLLTERDLLQLEKEVRNDFIAATLRLRQLIHSQKSRSTSSGQLKFKLKRNKQASNQEESKIIETKVPYVLNPMGLDVKTIQLLTKVVEAMCSGSSALPNRMQDYILQSVSLDENKS